MRQFLAAVKGESGAGGIAQDIANAISRIRDHPQWRKEYMLFELKMRDAKEEGRAEGQAEGLAKGLKQGRSEGRAEGLKQGRSEGRAEGLAEGREEMAKVMIRENEPDEKIAQYSGMSLQEVQELRTAMQ